MTLRLLSLLCVISASAMLTCFAWSQQQNQVALIIGNANYADLSAPLSTTIKDARLLADEFRRNSFEVDVKENVGKEAMQRAIDAFTGKIQSGSVALFYFSGIGIQVERRTYLIPVNAEVWSEADTKRDGISLDAIVAEMHRKGARVKIVIIDASRRNPFERRFRSVAAGLPALDEPENTLAMFSAAPGRVITDGTGDNSLFVGELVKEMRGPNLTTEEIFNHTRIGVSRASNDEQIPFVTSSLMEQFSFGPSAKVAAAAAAPAPSAPPATPPASAPASPKPTTTGPTSSGQTAAPQTPARVASQPSPSPALTATPSPPPQPAARQAEALVPETIPIIADRVRVTIRDEYLPAPDHKALAISSGPIGFITGQTDDDAAKAAALDICQRRADALRQPRKCELYALGNTVVYAGGRPPMPPAPWYNLDPSIEKPLVSNDIPLMRENGKALVDRNYLPSCEFEGAGDRPLGRLHLLRQPEEHRRGRAQGARSLRQ